MKVFDLEERQRLLRRLTHVTRDRDQAEDFLQEAFVRLAEYRQRNEVQNEAGFLVRAARNIAVDEARKSRTRLEFSAAIAAFAPSAELEPLQDERLLAQERLAQARTAIASLPPRTREVFLLHRFAELKYRDIGQRLGISVSAVEKHVARATLLLSNWMQAAGQAVDGPTVQTVEDRMAAGSPRRGDRVR